MKDWILSDSLVTMFCAVWLAAGATTPVSASPGSYEADSHTALLYHFNEGSGTNTLDASGNDRTAALNGGTSVTRPMSVWTNGLFRKAVFTVSNSSVSYTDTGAGRTSFLFTGRNLNNEANPAGYPTTEDFTVEMWVSGVVIRSHKQMLCGVSAGTSLDFSFMIATNGALEFTSNSLRAGSDPLSWNPEGWYHVAVVVNQTVTSLTAGSGDFKLYRTPAGESPAILVAHNPTGGRMTSSGSLADRSLSLGNRNWTSSLDPFTGMIEEFRFSTIDRAPDAFATLDMPQTTTTIIIR